MAAKKIVEKKVTKKIVNSTGMSSGTPSSEDKVIIVTKAGFEDLKKELLYLEVTRRKEIAAKIKEAVSYGDITENAEYEDAKNEQAFVEGRILQLNEQIKYAKIIDDEAAQQQSKKEMYVQLGNKVKIRPLSGKDAGLIYEYIIVGTTEADPLAGRISNEAPVGKALLGKQVGDKVDVKVPAGMIKYEILAIS